MTEDTSTGSALAVSAVMKKGSASVRVQDSLGLIMDPGPVTFMAKGANSFIFWASDSATGVFTVQWRRVGSKQAKASAFAAHVIGNDF